MGKEVRRNLDLLRGGVDDALEKTKRHRAPAVVRIGAYERISDDQESDDTGDRGAGVRRQQSANDDLARAVGWTITRHYTDNDVSAFKDVVRPQFEMLLGDLAEGLIDGIIVYDLDRLARRGDDLERVIKLYDSARRADRIMYFRSAHDAIDLSSPDGITLARVMIAFANKASRDTARRVAAQRRSVALEGEPVGGTRPFGWNWAYEDAGDSKGAGGRRKRRHVLNPKEAAEIRRVAAELLDGVGLISATKSLNARGVRTPRGNEWRPQVLKLMLTSPRLAGFRVHQKSVLINEATREWVKGHWEPILAESTWLALAELLTNPARAGERRSDSHRRYLLSGVLRCSLCSGFMAGNARHDGSWYYQCRVSNGASGRAGCGKTGVSGRGAERIIVELMKSRMREVDVEFETENEWPRETEIHKLKTRIARVIDRFGQVDASGQAVVLAEVRRLSEQVDCLRSERSDWIANRGRRRVQTRISRKTWDELSIDDQRRYVATELEAIYVRPATKRGNRFDPDRLMILWRLSGSESA